jgi:hypothetical protein
MMCAQDAILQGKGKVAQASVGKHSHHTFVVRQPVVKADGTHWLAHYAR